MLIFGHVGITTGIIKIYEKATKRKNLKNNNFIDYRIVMLGSLLPDIIDKPIVEIIYGLQNHEGHFIAHSFIFSGLMIIIGIIIFLMNTNKSVFLLGICSLVHQIFDKMMLIPNILFSSNVDLGNFRTEFPYLRNVVMYFEKPNVFISEVIGFTIIVYFAYKLFKNKGYIKFLKYGKL